MKRYQEHDLSKFDSQSNYKLSLEDRPRAVVPTTILQFCLQIYTRIMVLGNTKSLNFDTKCTIIVG